MNDDDQFEIHVVFRGSKKEYNPQLSSYIAHLHEEELKRKGINYYSEVIVVK